IKGLTVQKVLVDEAADIRSEIYLGAVLDRGARKVAIMASSEGGVEIEEVAAETPEKIITVHVHPLLGMQGYQARQLAYGIGLPKEHVSAFTKIAQSLYRAFVDSDASLAEINPLVINGDNRLQAVDGKILLDDSALPRQKELAAMRDSDEDSPTETEAREVGISYIDLDGEIGCMVNGAGLAMATMDIIKLYGAEPANFLDVGGGATREKVTEAFKIITSDPSVKGILVNIFGGIMRCDIIAEGVVAAVKEVGLKVPLVVRLEGTNVDDGKQIIDSSGLDVIAADNLKDGAEKIVKAVKG
ncbi:MAG: ADP-forming succinate--CoA ligase subunit beta, partial [Boseongicola sp. SB0667_bin_21]|nr:ADP-forming succinate--CoA ligase subunit beta [Boseongicola sp. SB0667_bin_21]